MDQLSTFGAEDIVDMSTDALHVYYMCCVLPLWRLLSSVPCVFRVLRVLRVPNVAPLRCLWGCLPVLHALCVVLTGDTVTHGPHGWPCGLHPNGGQRG